MCLNWSKLVQTCLNWSKLVQLCLNMFVLVFFRFLCRRSSPMEWPFAPLCDHQNKTKTKKYNCPLLNLLLYDYSFDHNIGLGKIRQDQKGSEGSERIRKVQKDQKGSDRFKSVSKFTFDSNILEIKICCKNKKFTNQQKTNVNAH